MARQYGGMIDNGTLWRVIDNLHRYELRAEGHDIEFGTQTFVLLNHLWDSNLLRLPTWVFENLDAITLCFLS